MPGNLTIWLAALLAVIGIAFGSYFEGRIDGKAIVQAQWDAERAKQQAQLTQTITTYREREQQLAQRVNDITEEKNRAVNDLEQRVAVLSDRVRKFAERPADLPAAASTAADGKGRSCPHEPVIYRPDAEFLAKEAERADKLRLSLMACQRQYEEAINGQ